MKRLWIGLLAVMLAFSLTACGGNETPAEDDVLQTGDSCPGKALGPEGAPVTPAAGFDPNEDMSFTTTDVNGNAVTNDVFAGTDRGVWLVFWQAGSDKSAAELAKLDGLTDAAAEHGYKIIGVVMDGEEHADKAAELAADLSFDNILWNDSVAQRFDGVLKFFTPEFYQENAESFGNIEPKPELGNPVSAMTNSRGQIQTSCTLVPLSGERIVSMMEVTDSNATYEELMAESQDILKGN